MALQALNYMQQDLVVAKKLGDTAGKSKYWKKHQTKTFTDPHRQSCVQLSSRVLDDANAGECRAHGNLGSAYFSKGNYKDALTSNRYQVTDDKDDKKYIATFPAGSRHEM